MLIDSYNLVFHNICMTSIDKAAIVWSIAIVACGVAFATVGHGIQEGNALVSTTTASSTTAGTDPFASIAEKVKENPSNTENILQEENTSMQTTETLKKDTKTFEEGITKSSSGNDIVTQQEAKDITSEVGKIGKDVTKEETQIGKEATNEETQIGKQAAELDEVAPTDAVVSIPSGTSTPGCEEDSNCFVPSKVRVLAGGEVTWVNEDSAAHTVTSGTPASGPEGVFDSGLILQGKDFTQVFETPGEYNYFCMVHPWMSGLVQVE